MVNLLLNGKEVFYLAEESIILKVRRKTVRKTVRRKAVRRKVRRKKWGERT